jgi:hypothetical protein
MTNSNDAKGPQTAGFSYSASVSTLSFCRLGRQTPKSLQLNSQIFRFSETAAGDFGSIATACRASSATLQTLRQTFVVYWHETTAISDRCPPIVSVV